MRALSQTLCVSLVAVLSACASTGSADTGPTSGGGAAAAPAPAPAAPPLAATQQPPSTPPGGGSATFSAAQADRGRDTFRGSCTECHYSSEFSDSQFKFKWSRRSAGDLYELIHTSMPETAPGSLSVEEAVELVTYILRMNGFEPGAGELASDRDVLDGISLASIRND